MQAISLPIPFEDEPPVATASKVPAATAFFWIIKILTTGMGETTSDFLLHSKHRGVAEAAVGLALAAAVLVQILSRRYHAGRYWMVVILVAVFGTMVADVIDFRFHLSLVISTALFSALVAAVLMAWWKTEGTLSIHSIFSRRRESFYWATVLLTFILGTAAGDLTATTLHLGYLGSGFLFFAMILVPLVAYHFLGLSEVLCFWVAYILTRPLGASFADWMSEGHSRGGLGLGPAKVSLIWALPIIALVIWVGTRRNRELPTVETSAPKN